MARETAFNHGKRLALAGESNAGGRRYETDKAQKAFIDGYIEGLKFKLPGRWIVQCNRESRIFAVNADPLKVLCPTCGRTYEKEEDGIYRSDRDLTILFKS